MSALYTSLSQNVLVVVFGETKILDHQAVELVRDDLAKIATDEGYSRVLIDVQHIELMTSMMIGEFVKFHKLCEQHGKKVVFCNLTPQLDELFQITRLNTMFTVAGTREKGFAAFKA